MRRFRETSLNNGKTEPVSIDIETSHGCITCLSLSPSSSFSLVVPFIDKGKPGYRYWPQDEEAAVWGEIQRILLSPIPKLFHNSTYDVMWLMHKYGLGINSLIEDTMILHHAMYLELQKSLRHLGSIYTDELAWKDMRGLDTAKRSDSE